MSELLKVLCATEPALRDRSLEAVCRDLPAESLLYECSQLDQFRRTCENLYQRVRALFFLYSLHRFQLPRLLTDAGLEAGRIPYAGYEHMLNRRYPEAIDVFLNRLTQSGPSVALSSALAEAYHRLAFQTLADQVRRSVRTVRGNQWMFRTGHPRRCSAANSPRAAQSLPCHRPIPRAPGTHGRPHGLLPQRLERYFLPRHGLP